MAQSNKVLVFINSPHNRVETFMDGLRRNCSFIATEKVSIDSGSPKLYEVEEKELEIAISNLTIWNPGVEVVAYRPYKSAIRPAGDLVMKEISKDGELPT